MIINLSPKLFKVGIIAGITLIALDFARDKYLCYLHSKNIHKDVGVILSNYVSKCHLIKDDSTEIIHDYMPIYSTINYNPTGWMVHETKWTIDETNIDFVKGLNDLKHKNPDKSVKCMVSSHEYRYKYVMITNYEDEIIVDLSELGHIHRRPYYGITL